MRYLVGIDLGTTNTVLYYRDLSRAAEAPQIFNIIQLVAPGETRALPSLPSFVYLPEPGELPPGSLSLPWADERGYAVGALARSCAASSPDRVVISGKSWLCADGVDRRSPLLPPTRANRERRISPLDAARMTLEHLRDAWNHSMAAEDGEARLEEQEIVLTVPASFDAVARELTGEAAQQAGLNVTLLEEPLAAFYAWLHQRGEQWRQELRPGDNVLVCDIGGGTSDFSLIRAADRDGNLELERVAVGRHILLGGDNLDLALAYTVAAGLQKERGMKFDNYQIVGMTAACREAKEKLLSDSSLPPQPVTVLGRGSSVIGGTITATVDSAVMQRVVVDGFFPPCRLDEKPQVPSQSGLRTFGLRYEADPAITRHLADFLSRHCVDSGTMPNKILLNGGVVKAEAIRTRLLETVQSWLPDGVTLTELHGNDPDLAVARGACGYGAVRQGEGIRVRAGSARSCYLGIESSMPAVPGFVMPLQALCVAEFGMEEGTAHDIAYHGLGLVVGETTNFHFFSSTVRSDDQPGLMLPDAVAAGLEEHAPLSAHLPAGEEIAAGSLIPVRLRAELTEIGTLQIWCLAEDRDLRWKLEFELRQESDRRS